MPLGFAPPAAAATLLTPIYISPQPGAQHYSSATTIALRFATPVSSTVMAATQFNVRGSASGLVSGKTILASDNRTIIFTPALRFAAGESVTVSFSGPAFATQSFSFGVSRREWPYVTKPVPIRLPAAPGAANATPAPTAVSTAVSTGVSTAAPPKPRYVTAPATLPVITFTNYSGINTGQYIFFSTFFTPHPYLLMLDEKGELAYYQTMLPNRAYVDFRALPDGRLIYFDGTGSNWGADGAYKLIDASYKSIATIGAGQGYETDNHDILFLPNGNRILMVYDQIPIDLSAQGGLSKTMLLDPIVQEIDPAGNVLLDWHTSDHLGFAETYEKMNSDPFDPFHNNSLALLEDGSLLISVRNASTVLKVDRDTGKVLWRMGGKKSDFKMGAGASFSYQHDVLWLGHGVMTMFDNGNNRDILFSRALQLQVDETKRTVAMSWEFRQKPDVYGVFMGNVQRLSDGNSFIGWGGPRSIATEVDPKGNKVLELEIVPPGGLVYRWYKLPWVGQPTTAPTLVAQDGKLYFSWNGATAVSAWRIEGSADGNTFTTLAHVSRTGFETSIAIAADLLKVCQYRVVAVDKAGTDLRTSQTVSRKGNGCG